MNLLVTKKQITASSLQPNQKAVKRVRPIIDWLSWWALFEKIHLDKELSAADKFQYLEQSVEKNTRAYDIIDSLPATVENYPKTIAALQGRFGNKKLLTQVYILFQMGLENLQNKPAISKVYDRLVGHVRSYLLEFLRQEVEREDQRNLMKTGIFSLKEKTTSSKKQTTCLTAASLHVNSATKIE